MTLYAQVVYDENDIAEGIKEETHFAIEVREPVQAVMAATMVSEFGEPARLVGDLDNVVLVANTDNEVSGTIAIIAVNKKVGSVGGVVHKTGGQNTKITQNMGEKVSSLFI